MLGTLLVSSRRHPLLTALPPPRQRCGSLHCFGLNEEPIFGEEEYKALAGIWRIHLNLEGRGLLMSLHLAAPELSESSGAWQGGKIHPSEEILCFGKFNMLLGDSEGWKSARWSAGRSVHPGEDGDDRISISLHLGNLRLEGRGRRFGIRCPAFVGDVFDGDGGLDACLPQRYLGDDPNRLGHFAMGLLTPIKTDTSALEERYQQRIEAEAPFAGDVTALLDALDDDDDDMFKELNEACDAGIEEACEVVSKEEEAKRAWLARQDAPAWGPDPEATRCTDPPLPPRGRERERES